MDKFFSGFDVEVRGRQVQKEEKNHDVIISEARNAFKFIKPDRMLLKSPHEDPDVCWSVAETDQLLKTGVGHPAFFGSFSF